MTATEQTTNDLRHGFTVFSTEGGRQIKTHIKIRLDDECRNGHETFSLTADIWRELGNNRWAECGGGCCHEHIIALRPDLKPFADLHLADQDGVPMHAFGNAFYWFAGFNGGLGKEYHGGNGSPGKSPEDCRRIFAGHIRATEAEVAAIVSALPRTEQELQAVLEDMGFPAKWKAQAQAAIRQLEEWTGKQFVSAATRKGFEPLTAEVRQIIADRRASGYYSPEQVAAREAEKAAARKAKRLADIRADHAREVAKAEAELKVKLYLAERFDGKVNAIYYTHSNTLTFNWSTLDKLMTREEFSAFVAAADLSALPQDIKFEFRDKPKY